MRRFWRLGGKRLRYHRVGCDRRPMVFRGEGTFAAGNAGCERYWTMLDGRLLIAGDDGRLTMKEFKMKEDQIRYLTSSEVAARLRVRPEEVLGWIRRAELRAINVGDGMRPQYRISPEDFDAFVKYREVQPPPSRAQRRGETMPKGGPLDPELGRRLEEEGKAVRYGNSYYRVWHGIVLYF